MRHSDRAAVPPWQPRAALALFASLLNFAWAAGVSGRPSAIGVVAMKSGRDWLARPTSVRLTSFLGLGLLTTGVIEVLSVHVLERWAFGPHVPVFLGVGLPPLLQWLLLPPIVFWLSRRHLGWNPRQVA